MEEIIKVENLCFEYEPGLQTISNISFQIHKGEYVAILGHNGSGKSTIAKLLIGLLEKKYGEIYIDDYQLNLENLYKIREKVGIIFQNPDNQFIGATVRDDIAFGLENICVPREQMDELINRYSKVVRMENFLDHEPTKLSGGQKQRVAIARALANNPDILLCDEATSALDIENTEEIVELLREINEKTHITIVFITHEMDVAKKLFDRIAFMEDGKLKEVTDIYSAFANPKSDIAKSLVQRVLNVEVPEGLKAKTNEEILRLSYTGDDSYDPVISVASKNYDITMDIINGKVDYIRNKPFGMLIVILRGEDAERKKALEYISKNVYKLERLGGR